MQIAGSNGDTIDLETMVPGAFFRPQGGRGFGIPPTEVIMAEGAGDGAGYRSTRRGPRVIDLPVVIFGADRQEVEDRQRRLARALSDRAGAPLLSAIYPSGEIYETRFHYTGGAETNYGTDGGESWARWVLTLRSPSPYWTRRNSSSFEVRVAASGRGLLPKLGMMKLTDSAALGVRTVENPGDVDARPVWTLTGPGDVFTITAETGETFSFTTPLEAGEVVTIDTRTARVTDGTGANRYADLSDAPKFFGLPAGSSQVTLQIENAGEGASIRCAYQPRREVMYG